MTLNVGALFPRKTAPLFWLGIGLATVNIPNWTSFAIPTGWTLLSCALPFFFLHKVEMGVAHWLGAAFLFYVVISFLWCPIPAQAVWDLWLLGILAASFMLGARCDLKPLFIGFALGLGVSDLPMVPQFFGWNAIPFLWRPAGLFFNANALGETALLVAVALISLRLWWPLVFTLPAIAVTFSRGAWLAGGVIGIVFLWQRFRLAGIALALAVLFPVLLLAAAKPDPGVSERIAIWTDTASGLSLFGHGPGSFWMLYPKYAKHSDTMQIRTEEAHNDFLELAFEFGIGALPLFTIFFFALWRTQEEAMWKTALAFLVIACVGFPMRVPIEGFLGMVALGSLCGSRLLSRGDVDHWRSTLSLWLSRRRSVGIPVGPVASHSAGIRGHET